VAGKRLDALGVCRTGSEMVSAMQR
jgi:hypothetical protein